MTMNAAHRNSALNRPRVTLQGVLGASGETLPAPCAPLAVEGVTLTDMWAPHLQSWKKGLRSELSCGQPRDLSVIDGIGRQVHAAAKFPGDTPPAHDHHAIAEARQLVAVSGHQEHGHVLDRA